MSEATGADRVQAEARPFQVDLRGVVDLLSRHIYSSPRVYLRELLQNGRDAIEARRAVDPDGGHGTLSIEPAREGGDFVFTDDGVGLTREEAEELLATVGRSSKRDDVLSLRREEFLGQFGIGLLSCFMVSDSILVRSRSARGGAPVEWLGRADGTFLVRELSGADAASVAVGTTVRLTPRPDDRSLLSEPVVSRLAAGFGEYLPVEVRVRAADGSWASVSRRPVFLDVVDPSGPDDALLDLGRDVVGATPLDVVPLESEGTGTRGVAFVLPYAPPPGAHQASRVYLGRMLLGERVADVLPDWAFFVRCVLDTTGLVPTASREQLVEGPELEDTRAELGAALRRWVLEQAAARPGAFARFLEVHQLALKALAVHDEELAATIVPMLSVDTSAGVMTVGEHLARSSALTGAATVRYAETVDEFRQIAAIAPADAPIVNGGYAYDAELLRRLPDIVPGTRVERVTVSAELDNLQPPPLDDRDRALALESRASAVLSDVSCTVVVRLFEPDGISSLYVADPEVLRRIERGRAKDAAPALWASLLDEIDEVMVSRFDDVGGRGGDGEAPSARLCLNWANRLVRTLAGVDDGLVFERSIHLLYAQAMLAGHRPLGPADRALLTTAMTDLVHLSVGLGADDQPDETPHDKDIR